MLSSALVSTGNFTAHRCAKGSSKVRTNSMAPTTGWPVDKLVLISGVEDRFPLSVLKGWSATGPELLPQAYTLALPYSLSAFHGFYLSKCVCSTGVLTLATLKLAVPTAGILTLHQPSITRQLPSSLSLTP